jgi:hypothetical protein
MPDPPLGLTALFAQSVGDHPPNFLASSIKSGAANFREPP